MKQILILFGGCSTEYGVSLQSAHAVLTHLDRTRYCPVPVGITRQGQWRYYTGSLGAIPDDRWQEEPGVPCTLCLDRGARALLLLDGTGRQLPFDAAFPVLHGKNGEDGTLQGLLELAGVPVIGCGTLSSALCMDKDRAHKLAAAAGIPVPKSFVAGRETPKDALYTFGESAGYPLFVKPVRAGSSFGVTKVSCRERLPAAVGQAFAYDDHVILEENIEGFEVGCAVMGTDSLTTGQVDEIELSGDFFDFEEKYTLKTSAIYVPARIAPGKAHEIRETAKRIYKALGCSGFARVDMFLTPQGKIYFNEVNTIPGFTQHSRFPGMMKAAGISFEEILDRIIGEAVRE